MTRSFKEPNVRIPNFGVEGAIPQPRPWWADFDLLPGDAPSKGDQPPIFFPFD